MMKPVLYMRKKGLLGSNFADHAGINALSKSVGDFIGRGATIDTIAPTVPTGLAVSNETVSTLDLSWNASTDAVGVAGYTVFREGIEVGSTVLTTFTDVGLVAATPYTYRVLSYDAANNKSSLTAGVTGTTI